MFLVEFIYAFNELGKSDALLVDPNIYTKSITRLVLAGEKDKARKKAQDWFDQVFNKNKNYELSGIMVLDTIS